MWIKIIGLRVHTDLTTSKSSASHRQWGKTAWQQMAMAGLQQLLIWDRRHNRNWLFRQHRDQLQRKTIIPLVLPDELFAFCIRKTGFEPNHLRSYRRQIEPVALNLAAARPCALIGRIDKTLGQTFTQLFAGTLSTTLNLNGKSKTTNNAGGDKWGAGELRRLILIMWTVGAIFEAGLWKCRRRLRLRNALGCQ